MKFIIDKLSKCVPRLGIVNDIERLPNFKLETPAPMLYTRGGSVPNVTHEVLQLLSDNTNNILQVPLRTTSQFVDSLCEYEGNISQFVGLKEYPSCLVVQDPGDFTPNGHHQKNHVPVWTRAGKIYVNSDTYMRSVEAFKPDMYCLLSDGDTNATSPCKRVSKAVDNTINFINACIERHNNCDRLINSAIIASIAGGYDLVARSRCIQALKHNELVAGFLIDGLHNNGPEMEFIPFQEIGSVVHHVVNELPENKIRLIHGCWNPSTILKLVQLGIDLFDTSYVHIVTERASALCFSFEENNTKYIYEINLRNAIYADDFSPLLKDCECMTCRKHTRAYINHLYNVQELLGPILLTVHNLHHYLKFFEKIRQSIQEDTLSQLEEHITKQFDEFQQNFKPTSNQEMKSTKLCL